MKKIILILAVVITSGLNTKAQSVVAKTAFNNTLKAYFETKNALAKDHVANASTGAKTLSANIENFPIHTLSEAQQTLWKTEAEIIRNSAAAISAEKVLKEQRNKFWKLSSSMLKLAKAFNLNDKAVYVQYCPMAKKSWLNEVEAVQNPFYGSMMYDCGEVTETIAKK